MDQSDHAFVSHLNGDHRQDDRACKGSEVAELAGAEAETGTLGVLARKQIGQSGDPERHRVCRHVPAVGEQRHRSGQPARHDLTHHHDGSQRHHDPGASFIPGVL